MNRFPTQITTDAELLDAIAAISSPNRAVQRLGMSVAGLKCWGLVQLQLKTPGVAQLRRMFADLHPSTRHVGVDDTLTGVEWFAEHRMRLGEAALSNGYTPLLQQFAKRGVPSTLRRAVWASLHGVGGGASAQLSAAARAAEETAEESSGRGRRSSSGGAARGGVPGWTGLPPSAVAPLTRKEQATVEQLLREWREVSFVTDSLAVEDVRRCCHDERSVCGVGLPRPTCIQWHHSPHTGAAFVVPCAGFLWQLLSVRGRVDGCGGGLLTGRVGRSQQRHPATQSYHGSRRRRLPLDRHTAQRCDSVQRLCHVSCRPAPCVWCGTC